MKMNTGHSLSGSRPRVVFKEGVPAQECQGLGEQSWQFLSLSGSLMGKYEVLALAVPHDSPPRLLLLAVSANAVLAVAAATLR